MRLDYQIRIDDIEVPRFSVEAVEGIGKLFTLATLVLNVLDAKSVIEIVFHGLNPEDPSRKIQAFQKIIDSANNVRKIEYEPGAGGSVPGSSSYYQWMTVRRS